MFNLLIAAKTSAVDRNWLGFCDEAYLVAVTIYFVIGFIGSRYSLWLEKRLSRSLRRSSLHQSNKPLPIR